MKAIALGLGLLLVAGAAVAEAPETSLRPVARPGSEVVAPAVDPVAEAAATETEAAETEPAEDAAPVAEVPATEAPAPDAEVADVPALPALPEPADADAPQGSILMTLMNAGVTPAETPDLPAADPAGEAAGLLDKVIGAGATDADEAAPAAPAEPDTGPEADPATAGTDESSRIVPDAPGTVTVSSSATQPWYELDASKFAPEASLRPVARTVPDPITRTGAEARAELFTVALSRFAPARSLRPDVRPPSIVHQARAAQEEQAAQTALLRRGAVCGDIEIQGEVIGNHPGPGACGVENAVRVRSVAGIQLSTPAIIDCQTARTFKRWVVEGMKPAVGNEGGGPVSMHIMAHYSCRNRIGTSSSRLSEHSFGHALDIGAIRLADGSSISVLNGWGTSDDGSQLRQMHRAACGLFGTVLGPEANAAHRNHFHFDTARYRSGSYCR